MVAEKRLTLLMVQSVDIWQVAAVEVKTLQLFGILVLSPCGCCLWVCGLSLVDGDRYQSRSNKQGLHLDILGRLGC